MDLTLETLATLLRTLGKLTDTWADTPLIAFTHIQPAEPSTLGYRLAQYAQDLLEDYKRLGIERAELRGKGFKGAVGTAASYSELIGVEALGDFEQKLSARLDLPFFAVATQTYPRKQDYNVLAALAGLAQSLYKLALDLRLLQSPPLGELAEPFGSKQVGSSAMPFKRNPINSEKVNSLARYLAQLPRVAWDNAAFSILERTLDDSANRRTILPEAFLAADEMLRVVNRVLSGLRVDEKAMARNLGVYGPFAATERVMMAAVKNGADRQEMHEIIREQSMAAWEVVRNGEPNPLTENMSKDKHILAFLKTEEIIELMDYRAHVGDAPQRAKAMAKTVFNKVNQ
jgi:adenylosuccinate lyase